MGSKKLRLTSTRSWRAACCMLQMIGGPMRRTAVVDHTHFVTDGHRSVRYRSDILGIVGRSPFRAASNSRGSIAIICLFDRQHRREPLSLLIRGDRRDTTGRRVSLQPFAPCTFPGLGPVNIRKREKDERMSPMCALSVRSGLLSLGSWRLRPPVSRARLLSILLCTGRCSETRRRDRRRNGPHEAPGGRKLPRWRALALKQSLRLAVRASVTSSGIFLMLASLA